MGHFGSKWERGEDRGYAPDPTPEEWAAILKEREEAAVREEARDKLLAELRPTIRPLAELAVGLTAAVHEGWVLCPQLWGNLRASLPHVHEDDIWHGINREVDRVIAAMSDFTQAYGTPTGLDPKHLTFAKIRHDWFGPLPKFEATCKARSWANEALQPGIAERLKREREEAKALAQNRQQSSKLLAVGMLAYSGLPIAERVKKARAILKDGGWSLDFLRAEGHFFGGDGLEKSWNPLAYGKRHGLEKPATGFRELLRETVKEGEVSPPTEADLVNAKNAHQFLIELVRKKIAEY